MFDVFYFTQKTSIYQVKHLKITSTASTLSKKIQNMNMKDTLIWNFRADNINQ